MAAGALQARREARKRRILENSENRLQQIFGKQESSLLESTSVEDEDEVHDIILPKANGNTPVLLESPPKSDKTNHPEGLHFSGTAGSYCDNDILEHEVEDVPLSLDRLLGKTQANKEEPQVKEETKCRPSVFQSVISRRLHIIILAILVRLCFAFSYGFLFGENLLLPFFVVELTEILMADKEPSSGSSGILGAALLLSGIIPRKVTFISNVFHRTSKLVQNFCLYLFTFIIFYAILEWPG